MKRILFPTDFSPCAEQAFRYAVELAVTLQADSVHILHVDQSYDELSETEDVSLADAPATLHLAEETVAELGEASADGGPELITRQVKAPSVGAAIVQYSIDEGIDVIVMGSHGRSGIKRLFTGSVAEYVARNATCSVLTVHGKERVHGKVSLKRFFVPVDFSALSLQVLKTAASLARAFDSHLDVVHVVEDVIVPRIYGVEPVLLSSESFRTRLKNKMARMAADAGVEHYRGYIVAGVAWREILKLVEETQPDLIVIGSRGLTGIEKILLGSVAENVIRRVPRPVMIVRGNSVGTMDPDALLDSVSLLG